MFETVVKTLWHQLTHTAGLPSNISIQKMPPAFVIWSILVSLNTQNSD